MKRSSVSVDIGGTFTDILLYDAGNNSLWKVKIPTSPHDHSESFLKGTERVLAASGKSLLHLRSITHGTTLVTNALLEKKTARVGLLLTQGFSDLLEIGRQTRPHLYDLKKEKPSPLVQPDDVIEVPERIDSQGNALKSLDIPETRRRIERLSRNKIETIAVSLLFSFLNDRHEKAIRKLLKDFFPEELIFLSSQVSPEFREYERTSTTVIAAAVAPVLISALKDIRSKLVASGAPTLPLNIMHSGGGMLTADEVIYRPHTMIESGPAAGVLAGGHLLKSIGIKKAITFDMGGTTAKAGLVLNGKPGYTTEYEVGSEVHQHQESYRTGYPVRFPMVDVAECGAGAGSIAWIDEGGHLKVGPRSAGADPGPACYGRGGAQPTVTDAYFILGYLHPGSFLGGRMAVYPGLAEIAIKTHLCRRLGLGIEETALAVYRIANANIIHLLRLVSVSRGHDPRDFVLVAFGGAGPLHASTLAEAMSIRKVIIPPLSGVFSSFGLLCADLTKDFVKTALLSLHKKSFDKISSVTAQLDHEARSWFQETKTPSSQQSQRYSLDMRYRHQNYELNVPLSSSNISPEKIARLQNRFHQLHRKVYGHSSPQERIQIVNIRLHAVKTCKKPHFPSIKSQAFKPVKKRAGSRRTLILQEADSSQAIKAVQCRVVNRETLAPEAVLQGPAIVQENESTTLVGTKWVLEVDKLGNLIMTRR